MFLPLCLGRHVGGGHPGPEHGMIRVFRVTVFVCSWVITRRKLHLIQLLDKTPGIVAAVQRLKE